MKPAKSSAGQGWRPKLLLYAALFCMTLFSSGCTEEPETVVVAAPVRLFALGETVAEPFRRFPGEVSALQTAEMSFDVPGRMIERPARQGAVMNKGDLLARLDPENFQSNVDSARARFTNARDELARQTQLRDRGVISVAELDRFRTEFEVAEAALRQAERALEDTRLLAPFDGRVARTLVNNFQTVQAKEPILVFQNISQLEVDIDVPERLMTLGDHGMNVEEGRAVIEAMVEFPSVPGRQFPVELKSFRTAADATARTFRVTFVFTPPEGLKVLPGMTGTVLLRRKGETAEPVVDSIFDVPVTAVGSWENAAVLWRLNAETMTAEPVPVELEGPVGESMRVRSEGLAPGEEIITTGVRMLFPGRPVSRLDPAPR